MTPKEKAEEIFNKYCYAIRTEETESEYWTNIIYAKECALIAVDELIIQENKYNNGSFYPLKYWQEVKEEIEKL